MINKIVEVNDQVNMIVRYVPDNERDVWQTPQYTAEHKTGDCEDIAILKFFLLLNNGMAERNLRLCYCTYNGQAHMVTLARHDDEWLVLDNNTYSVFPIEEYTAIKEKFRFNRNGIWIGEKQTRHLPLKVMGKWRDVVSSADAFLDLQLS